MGALVLDSAGKFTGNIVVLGFVPLVGWLLFHRKKESFPKFVGLYKPKLNMPVSVLIIICAAYAPFAKDAVLFFVDDATLKVIAESGSISGNTFTGLGVMAIPAALITGLFANGFCEELLYRGFILKQAKAKIGATGAIIVTAVLFALMHNGMVLIAGIPVSISYHIITFIVPFVGAYCLGL